MENYSLVGRRSVIRTVILQNVEPVMDYYYEKGKIIS